MSTERQQLLLLVVSYILFTVGTVKANYLPQQQDADVSLSRNKRYTDYQERASAYCTGVCMYEERKPYTDCFDLCNWTGVGPSPWIKLDKEKGRVAASSPAESSPAAEQGMASMLRTGAGRSRLGDKSKTRLRMGAKKATWDSY